MSWNCSSQFRRSGQRDDRRRLLLNEELCRGSGDGTSARAWSANRKDPFLRQSPHYGEEALTEQPRITDLIPRRLPAYLLLFTLGLASIAGIEGLHVWRLGGGSITAIGGFAAFDLAGAGGLAAWFLSATLLAASIASVLVYAVRRYRTDDYRGYYRIWLWAATCWMVMSIDATAGLREEFMDLMTRMTGTALHGDGTLWWAVPYLVLLSALGSRLVIDTWPARLSTAALCTAGACLASAAVMRLGFVAPESGAGNPMVTKGAEMLGSWMLFMAAALHARYVALDAEGLLPLPKADRLALAEDELSAELVVGENREWTAVDSPHQSPAPVLRRRTAAKPKPEPEFDTADAEASIGRKLTKQEKKALRQRLMRERLQREQTQQRKWA